MATANECPANRDDGRPAGAPPRALRAFLWIWVVGVLALYLLQFRPLMGPILRILGIL